MQAFASLDPALTQSVWTEYLADRTAIAVEGQRAYLGILNRYSMGRSWNTTRKENVLSGP